MNRKSRIAHQWEFLDPRLRRRTLGKSTDALVQLSLPPATASRQDGRLRGANDGAVMALHSYYLPF